MIIKSFCVLTFVGLVAAFQVFNASDVNVESLREPDFDHIPQVYWSEEFCGQHTDGTVFPNRDNCQDYLICWGGELWTLTCPEETLFDPIRLICNWAKEVECMDQVVSEPPVSDEPSDDPSYDKCPPPGNDEIRFLPSADCENFYVCINGDPILINCRNGQHWNQRKEICDDPSAAGCKVSCLKPKMDF